MKYATACSGIEAPSVAWEPLGWEPQWFSEVAPFPSAVLAHHWPNVPNLGDMTKIYENEIYKQSNFDVFLAGTPCQGFSLAGKRGGMDDVRSQLVWAYLDILSRKRPPWMAWENVPGVLSSENGEDFAAFLGAITGREISVPFGGWQNSGIIEGIPDAYGVAYRVLDAQYFGVAQRRRRMFVIGYLGDWRPAAAVLFERHSFGGHPAPCREKGKKATGNAQGGVGADCSPTLMGKNGVRLIDQVEAMVVQDVAGILCANGKAAGSVTQQDVNQNNLIITRPLAAFSGERKTDVAACLTAKNGVRGDLETETFLVEETANCLTANAHKGGHSTAGNNPGMVNPVICVQTNLSDAAFGSGIADDNSFTLTSKGKPHAVCFQQNTRDEVRYINGDGQIAGCLSAEAGMKQQNYIATPKLKVRRLTPIEYERLMGFPDNHTKIPYNGKPADRCADGPRYQACGNSIAVPVLRWLGERIEMVDKIIQR